MQTRLLFKYIVLAQHTGHEPFTGVTPAFTLNMCHT